MPCVLKVILFCLQNCYTWPMGSFHKHTYSQNKTLLLILATLAQMVAYLLLVQQDRGSIPGGVVNFHFKIFNLWARRGGDVHFLIARLYITGLD